MPPLETTGGTTSSTAGELTTQGEETTELTVSFFQIKIEKVFF